MTEAFLADWHSNQNCIILFFLAYRLAVHHYIELESGWFIERNDLVIASLKPQW